MDMTLPEQLVWAAVFAQEERDLHRNTPNGDVEGRMLSAAAYASYVVTYMRSSFKLAASKNSMRQHMGKVAFEHLMQMTYKADD